MAERTHPTLVEKMGGRAKFVQQLELMAADMKTQGFRFTEITVSAPSEFVEASGEVYAIVPFKLELTAPGNNTGTQPSYLIGVSKDCGHSWTFLDGSGVAGDRDKLRQVLPNFPNDLALPAKEKPTWQKGWRPMDQ